MAAPTAGLAANFGSQEKGIGSMSNTEDEPQERPQPFNEKELLQRHRMGCLPEDAPRLMATINAAGHMIGALRSKLEKTQQMQNAYQAALIIVTKKLGGKMALPDAEALAIKPGTKLQTTVDEKTHCIILQVIEPEQPKIVVAQDVPKNGSPAMRLIEKFGGKQ